MNVSNLFLISEFTQILDLIGNCNLITKYQFNGIEDLRFLIATRLNSNNDIIFTFNFYKKNKKVNITEMSNIHIQNFLDKFSLYIENLSPLKQDPKIPKYKTLLRRSKISLTLMKNIIKQSEMSHKILYLFIHKSLDIYTVDGSNNASISRTIIRSFDRINIIPGEFINNKNMEILMNLHNLNLTLFNYFIQNNMSLVFYSIMVVITVVRIYIFMVWILSNIGIFAISGLSMNDPVNILNNSLYYIINLIFIAIWLILPRAAIAVIGFKIKTGLNR
jgi:hypothetical protein